MYGVEPEKKETVPFQRWTEGKDKGSIYQFKQRDCQKDLLETLKSSAGCVWSQCQFLWINLIHSISRYFQIILVNIFNKVGGPWYFHFCVLDDN